MIEFLKSSFLYSPTKHHVDNYEYKVAENLICEIEPTNRHNQKAIAIKNEGQIVIGYVPEALAFKLFTLTL